MKNLTKGDFVKHNIYGKGMITDIYKNPLGQTCYEVYFDGLAKRVTVMDKNSLKPDYNPFQGIADALGLRHESSEDTMDQIRGIISILTDDDGDLPNAKTKTEKSPAKKEITECNDDCEEAKDCAAAKLGLVYKADKCPAELAQKAKEKYEKTHPREAVNHPSHYNTGKIEVIDYIESLGLGVGFNLGNAIKYLSRAGLKPGNEKEQDINKALWYIKRQKEAWSKSWQGQKVFSPSKISCLDYIEDKELMSYCTASAIDHIDASLAADTKNEAVWHLTKAENSLLYEVDHYYGKRGDEWWNLLFLHG